jgi:CRP/FNR family transcriptional regulator, cyclic AMP receptor protein
MTHYERSIVQSMASKKASLEHLRSVSLFAACSTKDLEKIAKVGEEVSFPAGTLIVDQGQTGTEAFVILTGTVIVKRNGKKVSSLGAGSIVGELSLLDHGPRTATVICETDCEFLLIGQRNFLAVVDEVPALSHKLMASLAGRIRDLDRQSFG